MKKEAGESTWDESLFASAAKSVKTIFWCELFSCVSLMVAFVGITEIIVWLALLLFFLIFIPMYAPVFMLIPIANNKAWIKNAVSAKNLVLLVFVSVGLYGLSTLTLISCNNIFNQPWPLYAIGWLVYVSFIMMGYGFVVYKRRLMNIALLFAEQVASERLRYRAKSVIKRFRMITIVLLGTLAAISIAMIQGIPIPRFLGTLLAFGFFVLWLFFTLEYLSLLHMFSEELSDAADRFELAELKTQYPPLSEKIE